MAFNLEEAMKDDEDEATKGREEVLKILRSAIRQLVVTGLIPNISGDKSWWKDSDDFIRQATRVFMEEGVFAYLLGDSCFIPLMGAQSKQLKEDRDVILAEVIELVQKRQVELIAKYNLKK